MSTATQMEPAYGFTPAQLEALDQEHAEREAREMEGREYETEAQFL